MAKAQMDGLAGVLDNLRALESKSAKKIIRHSLRAGAKPIQAEARQQAKRFDRPGTPSPVWKQITTRALKKRAANAYGAGFGVRIGVKNAGPGEPFNYARHLEHGTSSMAAQPFMRPAVDTKQQEALNAIAADLWAGIRKHTAT